MKLYHDNKAAININITHNPVQHNKTKCVEIDFFSINKHIYYQKAKRRKAYREYTGRRGLSTKDKRNKKPTDP